MAASAKTAETPRRRGRKSSSASRYFCGIKVGRTAAAVLKTKKARVTRPRDKMDAEFSTASPVPQAKFSVLARKFSAPPAAGGVGARGFEPPTSWSQTRRSTKLSYAPKLPAGGLIRRAGGNYAPSPPPGKRFLKPFRARLAPRVSGEERGKLASSAMGAGHFFSRGSRGCRWRARSGPTTGGRN